MALTRNQIAAARRYVQANAGPDADLILDMLGINPRPTRTRGKPGRPRLLVDTVMPEPRTVRAAAPDRPVHWPCGECGTPMWHREWPRSARAGRRSFGARGLCCTCYARVLRTRSHTRHNVA